MQTPRAVFDDIEQLTVEFHGVNEQPVPRCPPAPQAGLSHRKRVLQQQRLFGRLPADARVGLSGAVRQQARRSGRPVRPGHSAAQPAERPRQSRSARLSARDPRPCGARAPPPAAAPGRAPAGSAQELHARPVRECGRRRVSDVREPDQRAADGVFIRRGQERRLGMRRVDAIRRAGPPVPIASTRRARSASRAGSSSTTSASPTAESARTPASSTRWRIRSRQTATAASA